MGIINKIYSKKNIIPSSKIYSDHLKIERTENFHIHIRNLRIELDRNEYKSLSLAFVFAYIKWMLFGFKKNKPADNDILFKSNHIAIRPVVEKFFNRLSHICTNINN